MKTLALGGDGYLGWPSTLQRGGKCSADRETLQSS